MSHQANFSLPVDYEQAQAEIFTSLVDHFVKVGIIQFSFYLTPFSLTIA